MIEKVLCPGAEVGNVKGPSRQWNGQTKFMLFITLAAQREKAEALLRRLLQQRTIDCKQRRSLIVASVESAQHPIEFRNTDGSPNSRIDRIFADGRTKMCQPHSAIDG